MSSSGPAASEAQSNPSHRASASPLGRFAEWVKVDGDRLLVTFGLSALVFASLLALYLLGAIEFQNPNSVTRMASGMIAGSFSLVTLVVSVNQLILSQEFSPTGKYRDRLSGVLEFRRDIEERTDASIAPVQPTGTIAELAAAITRQAERLSESVAGHPDDEFEARVRELTARLEANNDWIDDRLDRSSVEVFDALAVAVEYNDAWFISAIRSIRDDAPEPSEELSAEFDELVETLRLFNVAQERFKTVYLQRELTRFSQLTVYCGIPAVFAAVSIALLYAEFDGAAIHIAYIPYVTLTLATVVFLPLALLASFILRTATLTRRTAATGPMVIGESTEGKPGDLAADDRDPEESRDGRRSVEEAG